MNESELVNIIKTSLRISSSALDAEILRHIQACTAELQRVGIIADESNPLIISAVELYCKWQYDYLGQAERFCAAFSSLRDALSLTVSFTKEAEDE